MPDDCLTDEMHRRLWLTFEWGTIWVGCNHGRPKSGIDPVRICLECFQAVLRLAEVDGLRERRTA